MRHPNWPQILNSIIKENLSTPFKWGTFDCCLWAANAVHAITGIDYAADFRSRYTTAIGAKRALKRYGKNSIEATLNHFLGPIKPRLNAGRGDVALINSENGPALGIVWGGTIWAAGERGLINLPFSACIGVWSVPCQQ